VDRQPLQEPRPTENPVGGQLSRAAQRELHEYGAARLGDSEATESAVRYELAGLRRLLRRSMSEGGPGTLAALVGEPELLGRLLREPGPDAAGRMTLTWTAVREYIRQREPLTAVATIESIEELLNPRLVRGWYLAERVPGGHGHRTMGRRTILEAIDLLALCEKATASAARIYSVRDRALLSMAAWTGLRWGEIVSLRWEQVTWEAEPEGRLFTAVVKVYRRGRRLEIPVHANAATDLARLLRISTGGRDRPAEGPVFPSPDPVRTHLTVREAQNILQRAAQAAGFPGLTLHDLKAAFADHLLTNYSLTEFELTNVLGYGEHKNVRDLLKHHRSWRLNEKADKQRKGGDND
jgi:integrase